MNSTKMLSSQQAIIMQHLVDGDSMKQIAEKMNIKKSTVGKYVRRVRIKIGAKNLYQCIAMLVAQGMENLTIEEIELALTAISQWEREFRVSGENWDDVDALEKKLERIKHALSSDQHFKV